MFSGHMPEPPPPTPGPKLSSWAGLLEAGIVEAVRFDPFTGAVEVVYTAAYLRVLRSLDVLLVDPGFVAALLIDDPVAMRMFIERVLVSLSRESERRDEAGQGS